MNTNKKRLILVILKNDEVVSDTCLIELVGNSVIDLNEGDFIIELIDD